MFGYMDFLIFYKWSMDWDAIQATHQGPPPSLINTMIAMPLNFGSMVCQYPLYGPFEKGTPDDPSCYVSTGFVQKAIQRILVIIAFVAVPWMLVPKPFLEYRAHQRHAEEHHSLDDEVEDDGGPPDTHGHGSHSLGDLFIHQAIETIEFVLGCVSNTASYLRLWALSLAHAELAKTFWELTMVKVINMDMKINFILLVPAFAAFACATLGVLMLMDMLECFLHALRLQWVEFQNKFYKADGYAFKPFNFKSAAN